MAVPDEGSNRGRRQLIDSRKFLADTDQVSATAPVATAAARRATAACCAPLTREPISPDQAAHLARQLRALADPARLRLVSIVASHDGGEACVCDLTARLGLTQPTVSHHLKILVEAGIFTRDKRGVWAYYALMPAALAALCAALTP